MIPEIGLMVGSYIFARLLAIMAQPPEQFSSPFLRIVVVIFAVLSIGITVVVSMDLLVRGGTANIPGMP